MIYKFMYIEHNENTDNKKSNIKGVIFSFSLSLSF